MPILRSLNHVIRTHPALGRMAIRAIPDMRWTLNVRGVGPMTISLRRNRSYWLRDPLTHEAFMLGAMQRLIHPGDVVFDVGANIGLYVRFMVQRFGAGKVIAFEPMSQNLAFLNRNIRLGHCQDTVHVVAKALADYDGIDSFQIDDMSSASGTLDIVAKGEASQGRRQYGFAPVTETVNVARLDSLIESTELPVPRVVKVDVVGAECRLLHGAAQTLKRQGPDLAIELHGPEASRAVIRFLLDAGYHIFGFLQTSRGRAYKEIVATDIAEITNPYSLHHCVASRDRERLQIPFSLQL